MRSIPSTRVDSFPRPVPSGEASSLTDIVNVGETFGENWAMPRYS